ncbi:RsiV family protein [uncultured Winogradskyella sp.]|uniref:RsiV family protein n=1 Tax=uncultured Winogradskyella sp. TaxID=395353 RepID=UPI0026308654|nr:RsiV family protein [uncultured Winogradskyella sp.]
MKLLYLTLFITVFLSCKNDNNQNITVDIDETKTTDSISDNSITNDSIQITDKDIEDVKKTISIELKQKKLIEKKDERQDLEALIIAKEYLVEKEDYTINFKYPLLNESFKPTNINFNNFINDYVNITKTESDILESKLLCDSIEAKTFREERFIDYKIYKVNDQLVSLLFYKENYYSGAMHPSYSFDCFNFDLERGVFMTYEDFFIQGSEEELVGIINESINEQIGKGELYYDCWEIFLDDFIASKNNFVFNDDLVEFYFDDCVICPSYTGTYSIELPLTDLLSVLRKYDLNPLVF